MKNFLSLSLPSATTPLPSANKFGIVPLKLTLISFLKSVTVNIIS